MRGRNSKPHPRSRWSFLLGLLCVALVILIGTIGATHTHARGEAFHADCGLCVSVHATVQTTTPAPDPVLVQVFTRVETSRPVRRPRFQLTFDLFTRPPPANAPLS
jgi:hypothetical protein